MNQKSLEKILSIATKSLAKNEMKFITKQYHSLVGINKNVSSISMHHAQNVMRHTTIRHFSSTANQKYQVANTCFYCILLIFNMMFYGFWNIPLFKALCSVEATRQIDNDP